MKVRFILLIFSSSIVHISVAQLLQTVHSFSPGESPESQLIRADDGNIYGLTKAGGVHGGGSIFRVTPGGVFTNLVSFEKSGHTWRPQNLFQGQDGYLYGLTYPNTSSTGGVFRADLHGNVTTLASFSETNGAFAAALLQGSDQHLYLRTAWSFYRITTNGEMTALFSEMVATNIFVENPVFLQAVDNNFYGISNPRPVPIDAGWSTGRVYRLTSEAHFTNFFAGSTGGPGGAPTTLIDGGDGKLYGTTRQIPSDTGTVFSVAFDGTTQTLATVDGFSSRLMRRRDGALYGTTRITRRPVPHKGSVFRVTTNGVYTALGFFYGTNGSDPGRLVEASDGCLYGTTKTGGESLRYTSSGYGTIFTVEVNGTLKTLASFHGTNGIAPFGPLIEGLDGALYGVTYGGGTHDGGTIFRLRIGPMLSSYSVDGSILLTWPLAYSNYIVEQTPNIAGTWMPVSTSPSTNGGTLCVTVPRTNNAFFRLRGP